MSFPLVMSCIRKNKKATFKWSDQNEDLYIDSLIEPDNSENILFLNRLLDDDSFNDTDLSFICCIKDSKNHIFNLFFSLLNSLLQLHKVNRRALLFPFLVIDNH
jgi:hypothetical protein